MRCLVDLYGIILCAGLLVMVGFIKHEQSD